MELVCSLADAITAYVHDGDVVAAEGFTHLIPFAAGHEIIRQNRRNLTLVRMTPDIIYDQMIGAGCAARLVFSWAGNPGVGSLHRVRDAVENDWPRPLQLEEHSHAGMACAYDAGAANLPFGVLRGYQGTELKAVNPQIRSVVCPFTGESLAAVPAIRPDVTIIHAQRADRHGNVVIEGIIGIQKEAALAARRTIVTVEEIVPELNTHHNACVLPHWTVAAVCVVPGGAFPSYAHGYYARSNAFYLGWDAISRDRERFQQWMGEFVHRVLVMTAGRYTPLELMTVAASRLLSDTDRCFVGIGVPSTACNLARLTHAPKLTLIYESGTIAARPTVLPLSIGDGELCDTALTTVSVPEMFRYWLQGGRINIGFLGAAQIDRHANLNTTVIGGYDRPTVRLPGSGGAQEIAAHCQCIYIVMTQTRRTFVDTLDFMTTLGHGAGGDARKELGLQTQGPVKVITDLCLLEPDPVTRELVVSTVHPGVTPEQIQQNTGWTLTYAPNLAVTAEPTDLELEILRDLHRRTDDANVA